MQAQNATSVIIALLITGQETVKIHVLLAQGGVISHMTISEFLGSLGSLGLWTWQKLKFLHKQSTSVQ